MQVTMDLKMPLLPMEATVADEVPVGEDWQYEPKWDGFRCLAFREGASVALQSKSGQPLGRYFPDIVEALSKLRVKRFVLDGEIVIPVKGRLSFDDLLMRVHPAESRVRKLAAEHPAMLIVFDLLAAERGTSLIDLTLKERRQRLEKFAGNYLSENPMLRLSPATNDLSQARKWFKLTGTNMDGIVAKRLDMNYRAGRRDGMQKIKWHRTADCVIGGFRYAEGKKVVGSLLLGLYDEDGLLNHVGFTSGIKAAERQKITKTLEPLIAAPGFTGHAPGGPSRWSTRRSAVCGPPSPS